MEFRAVAVTWLFYRRGDGQSWDRVPIKLPGRKARCIENSAVGEDLVANDWNRRPGDSTIAKTKPLLSSAVKSRIICFKLRTFVSQFKCWNPTIYLLSRSLLHCKTGVRRITRWDRLSTCGVEDCKVASHLPTTDSKVCDHGG